MNVSQNMFVIPFFPRHFITMTFQYIQQTHVFVLMWTVFWLCWCTRHNDHGCIPHELCVEKYSICCWCWNFCFRSTNNKWLRHARNKRDTLVDVVAAARMDKNSFSFHWSDRFHATEIFWIHALRRAFVVCFAFSLLNWWIAESHWMRWECCTCNAPHTHMRLSTLAKSSTLITICQLTEHSLSLTGDEKPPK